jgi:GDP-L-fucose synthase
MLKVIKKNFIIENNVEKELINVGSSEEISIKDLANLIKDITSYSGKIIFDENMPDGNPRKLLDSSFLHDLGWSSKIGLQDGLTRTYKWFVENYSEAKKQ